MKEPFERIAMDIVGPLPHSRRGNQYILVVCDYATRYPEAIPLHSIDAGAVAEHLIQLFSIVWCLMVLIVTERTKAPNLVQ